MGTHVYARTAFADPLAHVGDLDATDVDLPDAETLAGDDIQPDEWLEVATIPADAAVWVVRDGQLVDRDADPPPTG